MPERTATRGWDVLLRTGRSAVVRLVRVEDAPALRALNARVSLRTRYRRFLGAGEGLGDGYVDHLLQTLRTRDALVALVDDEVVAVASFGRAERDPSVADLALLVDDAHQSEGLGALLLEHLAHLARAQGVTAFTADVLLDNTPMRHLLASSGFAVRTLDTSLGVVELVVDLTAGPALLAALHQREGEAEHASLRDVLAPRGVVVVGSTRPGSVAQQVHASVRAGGYTGRLHLVDRRGRLTELEGPLDLAVLAVPASAVLDAARSAVEAGVRGVVVLSAGFAEGGEAGRRAQGELLRLCRRAGVRLIGPNCLGLVNTDPAVRLNATFCDAAPRAGHVALVSQSGAVGIAALRHAERRGAGLSVFVSTGNKADVSGNDLLAHLENDPRTGVIALYLESCGNARRFVQVASAVARTKPVVVVKAGRSDAGARAGQSHTAAATTPELAIGALLHEAGVIRADDLTELFDVVDVLTGPLPAGRRVAIVGNSGGPGVLAADECATHGLEVASLSAAARERLRLLAPDGASTANPVDLLATVSPEVFEAAVDAVLADPEVDAVITIYTPLSAGAEQAYAAALARCRARAPGKPLLASFPGLAWAPDALQDEQHEPVVPFFEFPEPAARALALVAGHAAWRRRPPAAPAAAPDRAAAAQARALVGRVDPDRTEGRWLPPRTAAAVLAAYGIPSARLLEATDGDGAVAAAASLGYPVALKAAGPAIVHKSDVGGVELGLPDEAAVRAAYAALRSRLGARCTSVLVQAMYDASESFELPAGVTVDPQVGPLVLVGAGGVLTDLLADRVVRMPAPSADVALEQLAALRCAPRFAGYRQLPVLDTAAAADVLVALGRLAVDLPEVREVDLNPLVLGPSGVLCLDARVRVGPPDDRPDLALRGLSRPQEEER